MTTRRVAGIAFDSEGVGEPLLLMHGTGGSRSHWKPVFLDFPGHGESDPPPEGLPHTPIGYAEVLAQMLDELGIESAHAAGNSVGGWTALELGKLAGPAR